MIKSFVIVNTFTCCFKKTKIILLLAVLNYKGHTSSVDKFTDILPTNLHFLNSQITSTMTICKVLTKSWQTLFQTLFVIQLGKVTKKSPVSSYLVISCLTNHRCRPKKVIKKHIREDGPRKLTSIQMFLEIN